MKKRMVNLTIALQKIKRPIDIAYLFPRMLALTAILLLILRSMIVADTSWDSLAYHLPFSALQAGLLTQDNFVLPEHLAASYFGFPSAIYHLKGLLWSVTGRAESAQLISVLSVMLFVLYAKNTFRIPAEWLVIGILAIPAIQIGASGNMTDVPANIGMAMIFLSLYRLITQPTPTNKSDLLWLLIACLIASGSKPQAVVVGGVLFIGYIAIFFLLSSNGTIKYSALLTKRMAVFWLVLCAAAISYPALINVYSYGNPIYPMQLTVGGIQLKGVYHANNWSDPAYLNSLPQQVRWLLSVLEFHVYDLRPIPYTIDQGSVPLTAKSFRMGGYFSPLILMSIFVIILLAIKKVQQGYTRGLLFLVCVTFFIASLPGSNELRYYSFWAISIVVIAIDQLESNKDDLELRGVLLSYKAFLVISFLFIVFITGGEYFTWRGNSYSELAKVMARDRTIIHHNTKVTFCYEGDFRGAILDSAIFSNPANLVVINANNGVCNESSR